ncbi:MAG: S53 family peptidase [Gammaproteobacteria bacterium]|nr:S53 family peptidase [Gammaproteobacteria bacterium]
MQNQFFPGWLPIQVASHYGFPLADWDGAGQTIAIISLGGKLDENDLRRDFRAMRIAWPDITIKDVSESYEEWQDNGSTAETHLDLEVIGTVCSGARITIYRGANDGGPGFVEAVKQAVRDDNDVISISWGHSESASDADATQMEGALKDAAAKGITICVAAGDGGSSDARKGFHAIPADDGLAHVQYPASSAYVLACGGTQLMLNGDEHVEVVWNNSAMKRPATGGGVSDLFEPPDWQVDHAAHILSANDGMRKGRVIPDVAALAAGGAWEMVEDGKTVVAGGTSAVAPLFASLIALCNQRRASVGKKRLGFLNARLYKLAKSGELFNNITAGHNRPVEDYPGYDAQHGFDACTGWGSPKTEALFEALVNLP